MTRSTLFLLSVPALLLAACASQDSSRSNQDGVLGSLSPVPGQVLIVTDGVALPPGRHFLPPIGTDGGDGVVLLENRVGITLDLTGVELRGTQTPGCSEDATGVGVRLVGCRGVTIRGGTIGGYKSCIVLEGCSDVRIEGTTFDGWFGQELGSSLTGEDPADRLRSFENQDGDWAQRYGGAIVAQRCGGLQVTGCKGRHGQNGFVGAQVSDARFVDNDFSFLSGWGLALFGSSRNVISRNRFDYCVRGYGHGVFAADHGAAGVLLAGRSCDNLVVTNSATHCGAGVVVHGGQDLLTETFDEDPGGSDRNLIFDNDLRFAVTCGLDATFSRQGIVKDNRFSGFREAGVRARSCRDWVISLNTFEDGRGAAVRMEHSQDCVVADNRMEGNEIGVELTFEPNPLLEDGPFGALRETTSRGHWILRNTFAGNDLDLVMAQSDSITLHGNGFDGDGSRLHVAELFAFEDPELDLATVASWLQGFDGSLPAGHVGRCTLRPWDGEAPAALLDAERIETPRAMGAQEVSAEARGEHKGGLETIVLGAQGPWDFRSGEPMPAASRPGGLLGRARWDGRWFRWDPATKDPRGDTEAWRALAEAPTVRREVGNFVHPFGADDVRRAVGTNHFGLIATTDLSLDLGGTFRLTITSDDGVRVFVDDEVVFEDWSWHAARREVVGLELGAGQHELRVEYFQVDGASALSLGLVRELIDG